MKAITVDYFKETGVIIGSLAYSRYDKSQAFSGNSGDGITRRWLHVQLVSHTARQLCRELGLNEDLAEAIALGHDLGHPPYGHAGEDCLNRLCIESGCGFFAHNAQSARILTVLEKGLDLSLPVLDGMLCHNGEMLTRQYIPDSGKTLEWFEAELNRCFAVPHFSKAIRPMTLEGCIVRASDVIAYIGRDIEDAITLGLITRGDIPEKIGTVLGDTEASIREALIDDVVRESYGGIISYSEHVFAALEALMAWCYRAIYAHTVPEKLRRERESKFRLFFYHALLQTKDKHSTIAMWANGIGESYASSTSNERMVVDYIASMTDAAFERAFDEIVRSN